MSQFIDAVKAELQNERRAAMWPLEPLRVSKTVSEVPFRELYEYKIGVEWRARVTCDPKRVGDAMSNVIHQLRIAVYGDLRERMLRLDRAILEHDEDRARMEMRDLMAEVGF